MLGSENTRRSHDRRTVLGMAGMAFTTSLAGCSSLDGPERNTDGLSVVGNARQGSYHLVQWEAILEEGEWDASEDIDVTGPRNVAFAVRAVSGSITIHLMTESEYQDSLPEDTSYSGLTVTDTEEEEVSVERFSTRGTSYLRLVADNTGAPEGAIEPDGESEVRIQMEVETF